MAQTDYDGSASERARFVERLLKRMLTVFDHDHAFSQSDRQFLLAKLEEVAA